MCETECPTLNQMKTEASSSFFPRWRRVYGFPALLPPFVSLAAFQGWAAVGTRDGRQICQVLLDPLGCDAARKWEITMRTDCVEVEGNKQINVLRQEKRVHWHFQVMSDALERQKPQVCSTFRALYSSHPGSSDASSHGSNRARPLVLRPEEVALPQRGASVPLCCLEKEHCSAVSWERVLSLKPP